MLRPGLMRHRIIIQAPPTGQDDAGANYGAWTTFATVYAEMRRGPVGREVEAAAQTQARVPVEFRIRYKAGVLPSFRVVHDSGVYYIVSAVDPDGRKAELVLTTEQRVEDQVGPDGGPYIPPPVTLAASQVTVAAISGLAATDAQAALAEHQADIDGHLASTSAHSAANITFAPTGSVAATSVQAAIAEVDAEKLPLSGGTLTGMLKYLDSTTAGAARGLEYWDSANTARAAGIGAYAPDAASPWTYLFMGFGTTPWGAASGLQLSATVLQWLGKASIDANGMLRVGIGNTSAPPAATSADRGKLWFQGGAAGVADKLYLCMKSAADTYSWVQVAP